jgi:hypothetical protein
MIGGLCEKVHFSKHLWLEKGVAIGALGALIMEQQTSGEDLLRESHPIYD